MMFKLLLVILTLLVIDNQAQRTNHINAVRYDLYKNSFLKDLTSKGDGEEAEDNQAPPCQSDTKGCKPRPMETRKRVWNQMELLNILRSLPREVPEPLIFVSDEFDE